MSIEEVAKRLQLHVRTVRRYVRTGRLKAVRIGKQYRIEPKDLAAFIGPSADALPSDEAAKRRHAEVTSVVHIDVISPEDAARLSSAIKGDAQAWHWPYGSVEVYTRYDRKRARLKLILTGTLSTVGDLIKQLYLLAAPWTLKK